MNQRDPLVVPRELWIVLVRAVGTQGIVYGFRTEGAARGFAGRKTDRELVGRYVQKIEREDRGVFSGFR